MSQIIEEMNAMASAAWADPDSIDVANIVKTLRTFWRYTPDPTHGTGYDKLADLIEAETNQPAEEPRTGESLALEMWHLLGVYPYSHGYDIWLDLFDYLPDWCRNDLVLEDEEHSTIDNAAKRIAEVDPEHAVKLAERLLAHAKRLNDE